MKVLLAVSGGIDSMYMSERASEIFAGASFAIAHCNFGLRGAESDGDEDFVRSWCREHGVECYVRRFETTAYAEQHGVSIEMAARDLRYAWFAELCQTGGFDAVAVAHNADDNAETMLLNMLRGTGGRGLRGMAEDSTVACLHILRPLLDCSRAEILEWMQSRGLSWREDSTNSETQYKRNKLRHLVMPVFKQINPQYLRTLRRDMDHIGQEHDIAERYFEQCELGSLEGGVNIKRLLSLPQWQWLLYRLCEPYHLSEETFDKLVALLSSDRTISGKTFQSPTHLIYIKGKMIYASPRNA